ncbi:ABC transporter, ATP-binding protein [Nitrospirillum viridazoti Y2]|uniref:ATP-binding cassette transporter n=1 Tax=Nitrospirillum amazonense TaxID=28077 RepID=A0A560INV9_9PROT|nr:ABC transporter ATP-binding protein/permease [Nitrospirillum amazonense]EGX99439.1 ABC transporter, ATP-binding protein [Nitrospirillum amazonense Y2]TWB60617.1 putative ATP-binding cassette transporter [Nitrospirillum amazonense]
MSMSNHTVKEARPQAGLPSVSTQVRVRHFLKLLTSYWVSSDWMFAWFGTAFLLGSKYIVIYLSVQANSWQHSFYDVVQNKQVDLFLPQIIKFFLINGCSAVALVLDVYFYGMFAMRWRAYLTTEYVARWMRNNGFYSMERAALIDNPDQRIAEDIKDFTNSIMAIVVGLFGSITAGISFGFVLWSAAAPIRFLIAGYHISIPGDMLWYSLLYTALTTGAIIWVGRPLISRTMRQQQVEADFRFGLIYIRRNAEQIAFLDAAPTEVQSLREAFDRIKKNYHRLILAQMGINATGHIFDSIGKLLPVFLTIPKYFAGTLTFGGVMAAQDAFRQMTSSLSFFYQAFQSFAQQIANVNRIWAFDQVLERGGTSGIQVIKKDNREIAARDLRLDFYHSASLTIGDWTILPGQRWVVVGPSGIGKSSTMRAIAGLWPDGAGVVQVPSQGLTMFVPQRLYLPIGTLKNAICFPASPERYDDDQVISLLSIVGLETHAKRLHESRSWADQLSPGEQQRLALVRILLYRPDRLVLDEATSALDMANALHFYTTLLERLPSVTLISVVHDERLKPFHTHCLRLAADGVTQAPLALKEETVC